MINGVVDTEEAVVSVLELVNGNSLVLCVMSLQVEGELLSDAAGVNLRTNSIGSLVKHGQHRVIHIIVEQDNATFGTSDEVVDKGVGIENLSIVEDALRRRQSGADEEVNLLL